MLRMTTAKQLVGYLHRFLWSAYVPAVKQRQTPCRC